MQVMGIQQYLLQAFILSGDKINKQTVLTRVQPCERVACLLIHLAYHFTTTD
jgi:hypothetical protein